MSRVLFAWELGANLGHIATMLALAKELRARGHRPVFALRDLSNALLLTRERFAFFPAPSRVSAARRGAYPSYAAMLSGEAFPSVNMTLAGALAWRSIFKAVRPHLLIADHAPTALLAARGLDFPAATFGVPFSAPVLGRALPVFGEDADAARGEEKRLLARLNTALAALRAPRLDAVADLYRARATMVRGFEEADCFAPRAPEDYVTIPSADAGDALPEWPVAKGAKVFAYLRPGPWLEPVCEALQARGSSAIACVSGLDQKAASRLQRSGVRVARELCKFSALIEQSDVVLCHGSHNTVTESMLTGKPLVMLPTYVEQLLTSARVVAAGAGAVPAKINVASIIASLDQVGPGSAARQLARKIAAKRSAAGGRTVQAADRVQAALA